MSVNGQIQLPAIDLITYLLGKPESTSFDNGQTDSPSWFSPDIPFCISASTPKSKSYTFGQLKQSVRELASGLRKAGLQDGDRLMLFAPDSLYVPLVMLATWAAGGIFVSRDIVSTAKQQAHFIQHAQPKIVFAGKGYEETVMEAARHAGHGNKRPYSFGALARPGEVVEHVSSSFNDWNTLFDRISGPNFQWRRPLNPAEMSTTVLIEYTSGFSTTSDPKGVEHTHASLLYTLEHALRTPHQIVIYNDFSFSQLAAKTVFLSSLRSRNTLIVPDEPFSLPTYLARLSQFRPQILTTVKRTIDALLSCTTKPDLSFIQATMWSGQIIPQKTRLAINALCGHRNVVVVGYGSTETGTISRSRPGQAPRGTTCQGYLEQGVEGKVVDEHGVVLSNGQQGRLLFRTPGMMKGYWCNPGLTAETIDKEGYLDTGDIGYVDKMTGEWHVTGRIKEIIKVQGKSVSPNAIEEVLLSLDWVATAVVVAAMEDGEEMPTAFIVRSHDRDEETGEDERRALAIVEEELNSYHRLTGGVIFLAPAEVPYGGNGKIMRQVLKARAQKSWDDMRMENGDRKQ